MKSIDPNNMLAVQEISKRQREMNEQFKLAETLEASHQYFESLRQYEKARHNSYPVGKGLKVTIMIEPSDLDNWHKINKKIEAVKIKIRLQRSIS
ncbi:hypothetical protein [Legionella drancourtii]|uniref:Uncharacterized protein n=1 Tax=Legionella drancourtii LLAP12 TaxID=658187 RepID=G9EIK7_9GAMM|nr:hypothetical protein [Legionella drancourtii]EHL32775.1 hypothetical protein LDG_5012 [Legionella drancourtii LLAP12]